MRNLAIPALLVAVVALAGCGSSSSDGSGAPPVTPPSDQQPAEAGMKLTGTVRQVGVEGGCWVFEATDGRRFELSRTGAPAEVFQDGRKLTLSLNPRPDLMSACQVGPIVEITRVESGQ